MIRDHTRPGASRWRWIPNALTVMRALLVIPLAIVIVQERHLAALMVAFVAGLSDGLDGFLAKRFAWQSRFGGIADPIADKLMLTVAFLACAIAGLLPWWLAWTVVIRDLIIITGATTYHYLIAPVPAAPSVLGKMNTAAQIVLLLIALAAGAGLMAAPWLSLAWPALAALTVISGLHYVVVWSRKAWVE